jgi:hypothetical protein
MAYSRHKPFVREVYNGFERPLSALKRNSISKG